MAIELAKVYIPKEVEQVWYQFWQTHAFFHAEPDPEKKPYCIVIPPPNVTGILHMGHALNETIQDVLIRWRRMQGYSTLWLPGTDHAGIATQNVVERRLAVQQKTRESIGREQFIQEVWKWKEEYHRTIVSQIKRLGNSCDWDRERFTMDEGLSEAVQEVFIRLYKKGLIYRGNYIINWCPRCQTALSDEEAQHKDKEGALYHIKYPVHSSSEHIVVATTRPETMLGDTAVAIHPSDTRYMHLHGKQVCLPLVDRLIPVIVDEMVDQEFGTGIVKVTPAHDPNDFMMGLKHRLPFVNVMNKDGSMNANVPEELIGMDRFEAREAVIAVLKEKGLLVKVEPHVHAVGHCYRCHTVVEPYLSLQWFVKMKPLAEPALQAGRNGDITFFPARWTKVYLNWLENIRDWCISRQIWWGHRIPVYYCQDCYQEEAVKTGKCEGGKVRGEVVAKTKPLHCPDCGSPRMVQDEDVLDTWFSSWLWPFSTLGWPHHTKDLSYFYPTSTLVTGQDIIFFWVARMIMAGLECMGKVPFAHVDIHGIVRDQEGAKMSKSLGNIIDPLEIIDEYGADALRFSIVSLTSVGQDVYLSKEKFETGRNFGNKLWNAARFLLMNIQAHNVSDVLPDTKDLSLVDQWLLSRLQSTIAQLNEHLEKYRLNDAALVVYEFTWHVYCDWYVECSKLDFASKDARRIKTVSAIAWHVLETILRLLHPFMPFITEEIWQTLKREKQDACLWPESIMIAAWPAYNASLCDPDKEARVQCCLDIVTAVRNIRAEMNIPVSQKCTLYIQIEDKVMQDTLQQFQPYLMVLGQLQQVHISHHMERHVHSVSHIVGPCTLCMPLEGLIDINQQIQRLEKKIQEQEKIFVGMQTRLQNPGFVAKAPPEVIEAQRVTAGELVQKIERMKQIVDELKRDI